MSLSLLLLVTSLITHAAAQSSRLWNFDTEPPNTVPSGFQVGSLFDGGRAGDWQVIATEKAKSPGQVIAQLQGKGAEHAYKVILVDGTESSDIDLAVSFLAIQGKGDMGGGLLWRATDDRNYYLARANPLEQNLRIYRVTKGVRHMLQNFDQILDVKNWHTLRVAAKGCRLQVFYDDKPVFDFCDHTFEKGRIGLWTKSDAVTYFDDLMFQILK